MFQIDKIAERLPERFHAFLNDWSVSFYLRFVSFTVVDALCFVLIGVYKCYHTYMVGWSIYMNFKIFQYCGVNIIAIIICMHTRHRPWSETETAAACELVEQEEYFFDQVRENLLILLGLSLLLWPMPLLLLCYFIMSAAPVSSASTTDYIDNITATVTTIATSVIHTYECIFIRSIYIQDTYDIIYIYTEFHSMRKSSFWV